MLEIQGNQLNKGEQELYCRGMDPKKGTLSLDNKERRKYLFIFFNLWISMTSNFKLVFS